MQVSESNNEIPAYDAQAIETKWQRTWEETQLYKTDEDPAKPKKYVLEIIPCVPPSPRTPPSLPRSTPTSRPAPARAKSYRWAAASARCVARAR